MNKTKLVSILPIMLIVCVFLFIGGCGGSEPGTDAGKMLSDLQKEYGDKSTDELIAQFETQVSEYDAMIAELTAQAGMLDPAAADEINRSIEDLQAQRDQARETIDAVGAMRENFLEGALKSLGMEETYKKLVAILNLFQ